jgi:hypothetical protein
MERISIVACISAAGESLIPYIVTSQDTPSLREHLKKRGAHFGTDFILKSRAKPYINTEIFAEYARTVFLPNLNEVRILAEFAGEEAILLIDNCPSHVTESVLALPRDARM